MHKIELSKGNIPGIQNNQPTRRQSRLSLKVWVYLVIVGVLGGGTGFLGYRARFQRETLGAIRGEGGFACYTWDLRDGELIDGEEDHTPWPKWLVRIFGHDFFGTIVEVGFHVFPDTIEPRVTYAPMDEKALLKRVGRFGGLEHLDLSNCRKIDDDDLMHLQGLTRLKVLNLAASGVRGSGLVHLKGLKYLKELDLTDIPITDEDLILLLEIKNLESLKMSSQFITDAGMRTFRYMKYLNSLSLVDSNITSDGLANLKGLNIRSLIIRGSNINHLTALEYLTELEDLNLISMSIANNDLASLSKMRSLTSLRLDANPLIDDEGMLHIGNINILKDLTLDSMPISDVGLLRLKNLKNLRRLSVVNTKVTRTGVASLKAELPNVTIIGPKPSPFDTAP